MVEAIINPELLIWARDSAGFSKEEAAKKVKVKPGMLEKWENGDLRPTVNQLRKLGSAYKRPLAIFYLPKPPKKFKLLDDFRRLPIQISAKVSPLLRFEIRQARYRREVALDLYQMIGESIPELFSTAELSEKPESLALRIRKLLGITPNDQFKWIYTNEAFSSWRRALENLGILVFQASRIDLSEMRGFSISDTPLPAIVVNVKDSYAGRIFTMMHELVHIVLKKGGLCDLEEEALRSKEKQEIEIFCNHVAGATLIPKEQLLNEKIVFEKSGATEWDDEEIKQLTNKYKVSREVVLRRLLITGYTTNEFYREKREEYGKKIVEIRKKKKEGFPPLHIKIVSNAGHHFVRLVINSYYNNKITSSDVSDFLGVRLKHMVNIEKLVIGDSFIFGSRK